MVASNRVIALAEVLGTAPVLAELELVREVAELEPAAESLAIVLAAARALVIVRGVVPELAIDLAEALVLIIDPAEVRELETGPVGAELELRTVLVAQPVPNQPHGHLAVPAKTKSVTALHRHDLAAVLMAGDLAVAEAETMRERAATEVGTAWEAAATVAVVAVVVMVG
jgi:hypothetical protein